jgi:hypothetical protein
MTDTTVTPDQLDEQVTETPSGDETPESPPEGDTFPRDYVEKLRGESAKHRTEAKTQTDRAEALAGRLHLALVTAAGRLADPSDLPFNAAHLESDEALSAAIDELLERKPHLASRRVAGDIGQGAGGTAPVGTDLAGILRLNA